MKQINRRKGKGLIRSANRKGVSASKKPAVARAGGVFKEPSVCERCGAVWERSRWRRNGGLANALLDKAQWVDCPACVQSRRGIAYGKVVIAGDFARKNLELIRRRVANIERRASFTQPERRIVSSDWNGDNLEVFTTSQKLAHRIARELEKLFGGRAKYSWSDSDGSLLATWTAAPR